MSMLNFENVIKLLESNKLCNLSELKKILIDIVTNLLKHPVRYVGMRKENFLISQILSLKGGKLMLRLMGFMETVDGFVYPKIEDLTNRDDILSYYLKNIHIKIVEWEPVAREIDAELREIINNIDREFTPCRCIPLPQQMFHQKFMNPFLDRVSKHFHSAQLFNDESLRENARKQIPYTILRINVQKKMRNLQKLCKEGKCDESSISVNELMIIELLRWFKEEFFAWMDSPKCTKCGKITTFSHYSIDIEMLRNADKVEVYICEECWLMVFFPRYNNPHILLETRVGRCGEWAMVFTLLCHALRYDARLVIDETDHVWTEVYSSLKKRWIHCDPCENAYDTPLMYENGWGKKLTYVMAYSPSELQDVTWRYSSKHKDVLKRRKNCTEEDLNKVIVDLRNYRLNMFTPLKRKYILKRCCEELVELLQERHPKDNEMQGRSSGALDWRITRGEVKQMPQFTPYTFILKPEESPPIVPCTTEFDLKYCCAIDKYIINGEETLDSWYKGVYAATNMMRKEEHDWQQVYLCRTEGANSGYIAWHFKLDESIILNISLKISNKIFENGEVKIKVSDENGKQIVLFDNNCLRGNYFHGSTSLLIEVYLTGGKGTEAWQHAQLFRQCLNCTEYTFELSIEYTCYIQI